jgi:class 3 adenylate cyclase
VVTERVERRLSAVLAADVTGYSRLMGLDEEGTLAQLKAHRHALIDPKIARRRWVELLVSTPLIVKLRGGNPVVDDGEEPR